MTLSVPSGFTIRRNGTCLLSEVDCGQTVAPFRDCCPAGGSCPNQYNVDCCPSPAKCTQALLQKQAPTRNMRLAGVNEADSVAKYELLASKQPTSAIEFQENPK